MISTARKVSSTGTLRTTGMVSSVQITSLTGTSRAGRSPLSLRTDRRCEAAWSRGSDGWMSSDGLSLYGTIRTVAPGRTDSLQLSALASSRGPGGDAMDFLEQVKDGVAILTMNRPERLNAMSRPMLEAMEAALARLAGALEIGAVVLTVGGRAFCAGGDVKAMAEGTEGAGGSLEERAQQLRARMEVSRWLHEMPKPTIAMVRGAAAGAGLSLAMACDLRMASDNARFATAFARVGYSGDFGGSYYLTQLVGTAKARELYYTAALVDAKEALALGLVNRVVADADLEKETMALATRLAAGPRVALRYMKRNMNAAEAGTLKELLDLEAWHHTRCGMTEDHREAARAFVEKREPVFKGR